METYRGKCVFCTSVHELLHQINHPTVKQNRSEARWSRADICSDKTFCFLFSSTFFFPLFSCQAFSPEEEIGPKCSFPEPELYSFALILFILSVISLCLFSLKFSDLPSSFNPLTPSLPLFCPQMKCCGWTGPGNWSENISVKNSSLNLYACSCRNDTLPGTDKKESGLCEHLSSDLPVYETVRNTPDVCMPMIQITMSPVSAVTWVMLLFVATNSARLSVKMLLLRLHVFTLFKICLEQMYCNLISIIMLGIHYFMLLYILFSIFHCYVLISYATKDRMWIWHACFVLKELAPSFPHCVSWTCCVTPVSSSLWHCGCTFSAQWIQTAEA